MKLRNVPGDELEEIHALLAEHAIEVYETEAGNWGISMPALWLHDEARFSEARALLDAYALERQARVRREYETLKAAGKARSMLDIARENPVRFVVYLILAAGLFWVSTVPYIRMLGV